MSLLTVCNEVAAVVSVHRFTTIFGDINNQRTQQEFLAHANEAGRTIAHDTRDWTNLRLTQTFTGNGIADAFVLPANFLRLPKNGNIWRSTSAVQPMQFIPDPDEWLQRRLRGINDSWGEWTIMAIALPGEGGKTARALYVYPIMGTGTSIKFAYQDKNFVDLASGGVGDEFQSDNDTFRLPEKLLKLCMIWKWKALKGSPYAEDLGNYETAVAYVEGSDSPSPILVGRLPVSRGTRIAYPWPVPTVL